MRNIHLLETKQPSRLHYFTANKEGYYLYPNNELVTPVNPNCINQFMYITVESPMKEGDWFLTVTNSVLLFDKGTSELGVAYLGGRKIILTNNKDLVGVQAIPEEFLEWFVRNSGCKSVGINEISRCCGRCDGVNDICYADQYCILHNSLGCEECFGKRVEYSILIPKEESYIPNVIKEVKAEMDRQDNKWGKQTHSPIEWIAILTEEVGETAKEAVDFHFANGISDMKHIGVKVIQESRLEKYRIEMIQVAAVAIQAINDLDTQTDRKNW